jgi:hypothetical protein
MEVALPYPGDSQPLRPSKAEDLFREIRIENAFTDADGQTVALKDGAHVDVSFEADAQDTVRNGTDGDA